MNIYRTSVFIFFISLYFTHVLTLVELLLLVCFQFAHGIS